MITRLVFWLRAFDRISRTTMIRSRILILFVVLQFFIDEIDQVEGENNQYPICFCVTEMKRIYLGQVESFSCSTVESEVQCQQKKFLSNDYFQIMPVIENQVQCWKRETCLDLLPFNFSCIRCDPTESGSHYPIFSYSANENCFPLCPGDPSCQSFCFHHVHLASIRCQQCSMIKSSINCTCVNPNDSFQQRFSSTTLRMRWMEKRGFPAAAILALLVALTFLLTLIIKQIYRQIDIIQRRRQGFLRDSMIPSCNDGQSTTRVLLPRTVQ